MKNIILSSILAGICISLGGIVFLKVGGIAGAVLFAFGLIMVIHYKLKLFTGTVGFVASKKEAFESLIVLLGNIIGCAIMGAMVNIAIPSIIPTATAILTNRLGNSLISDFLLAGGCGFIMTGIVQFGRMGKFLPLVFGIPVFILSGFIHSIADAFYYSTAFMAVFQQPLHVLLIYAIIVLGNTFGCNLYRIILLKRNYDEFLEY